MWRILLLVLLFITPAAQGAGPTASLEVGQVLRGAFVQERHLQGFNAPLRSEGHFVLVPGRGLIWKAEKPFAITTVITAAGLVQDVGGAETMRLPAAKLPFLSRLYHMLGGALAGDWRALDGDFSVTRSGGNDAWQVDLTPRKGGDPVAMPFQSIQAKGSRFVDQVRMSKPDGDFDTLRFVDQVLSTAPLTAQESASLESLQP